MRASRLFLDLARESFFSSAHLTLSLDSDRYDTGQIADFLVMDDFKLRFATCTTPGDAASCTFSNVRSGLIVGMLSIGTLIGSLIGAL